MKVDLSIVTCGYKSEDTIVPFLDAIKKNQAGLNLEVIVVDNYPADKGADLAEKHPLKPVVIRNTENVGFSKAINRGLRESKGDYLLIINPDTRIVGKALKYLVDYAKKHPNVGAVAPKLLFNDGKIQPSVFKLPNIKNAFKQYFLGCKNCFGKYYPGNKPTRVEVAVMAAFLIPRSTYQKIGGLDEKFFLYYEDVEYCRRLAKYKLPIYFYPKAVVKHAHGASGSFVSHLKSPLAKSAEIYYGKFYSDTLNTVLWAGQKWQKLLKLITRR